MIKPTKIYIYIILSMYIYILYISCACVYTCVYIYMCVCVPCVYVAMQCTDIYAIAGTVEMMGI